LNLLNLKPYILRINSSIWLENKNKEILALKQELNKYKNL